MTSEIEFQNIAYNVIKNFVGEILSNSDLREIIEKSYNNFSSKKIVT